MASKATILHPQNETEHSASRITKEGKKITYNLKVIQQPERARACGAGAKSSADRRPVDPPPVVEMRIYESDPNNDMHKTDITFSYNANFFLFTTLEFARPIAHGRIQGQPASCPVLTGVPVAGIAYLDRPSQAGYFIFPDLSVRHEGVYRLNFSLYEEPKDSKDEDKTSPPHMSGPIDHSNPLKPRQPQTHMYFRLEVKTLPFTVYSAKKFPGLSESTSLSRIVAEQGCRVRIRRDVRMRRREPKSTKDFGYDERHMTPDTYPGTPIERPRSTSNASIDSSYGYCPTPQRAPSDQNYPYNHPYQQPGSIPLPGPPVQAPQQSHLSFGPPQPQYCTPQIPGPPPPAATSAVQPPPAPYASPLPSYSQVRPHHDTEYDSRAQKYSYLSSKPHREPKTLPPITIPNEIPRSHDPQMHYSRKLSDPKVFQSAPHMPPPSQNTTHHRIPIAIAPEPDTTPSSGSSASLVGATFDPSPKGGWSSKHETASSTKRLHSDVFGSGHQNRRLNDGKRPDTLPEPTASNTGRQIPIADDDDLDFAAAGMVYKRADGRIASKLTAATQKIH
ncbi:velvet protein [Myotisia sp. PD_48]|nr:velvet protein [Myotisia sp. PD_48]